MPKEPHVQSSFPSNLNPLSKDYPLILNEHLYLYLP